MTAQDESRRSGLSYSLEVITVPVSDVDRALDFYASGLGFTVDVDYAPTRDFRVVQLTPRGSAASVQIGTELTDAEPGSLEGLYLVVSDLETIQRQLTARGVDLGAIRHKASVADGNRSNDVSERGYRLLGAGRRTGCGGTAVVNSLGQFTPSGARSTPG